MTYYLKYRPQKLDELDLTQVRESLKKIVRSKNIPHALLFFGPKGSGKTSAARILAKVVNCESTSRKLRGSGKLEPCNRCEQCKSTTQGSNIDVIELDAASHRGIDDIRNLKDAVKLSPAKAKKKVYVIDEAHMLTTEASNALLKTLEEPPDHVMFILATTIKEKLIETIRSRSTNIIFKRATMEEIERSLKKVVRSEKLKPEKGVLKSIAKAANGSFRDAVKILEQLVSEKKKLNLSVVENYLFQRKAFDVEEFLSYLADKDVKRAVELIESAVSQGASMRTLTEELLKRLQEALLANIGISDNTIEGFDKEDLIILIRLVNRSSDELRGAVLEQIPLEIAIIEWCEVEDDEKKVHNPVPAKESNPPKKMSASNPSNSNPEDVVTQKTVVAGSIEDGVWKKILATIRPINTSIEALLRAARPVGFDGKTLTLGVFYRFHKERLEENRHRRVLEDVVERVFGNPTRVVCTLAEPPLKIENKKETDFVVEKKDTVLTDAEDEDIISAAKEIFGS
jgi:DNA polymerase-3 subunit gamma/tau